MGRRGGVVSITSEQRAQVNDAITRAHANLGEGIPARTIAAAVVADLTDTQRFGQHWVEGYLASLAVDGMMRRCADWRRSQARTIARTTAGHAVEVPVFAGIVTPDGHRQVRFEDMTAAEVQGHLDHLIATRNTLSAQVQFLRDTLATMVETGARTVGEALVVAA